jgi:lysophospholipase L1-like esterase
MKNILSIIALLFAISTAIMAQTNSENTAPSDLARIYKAMDKGRKGEEIKIGIIGGSITAGTAASSESKRWTNLMADWWEVKFPDSKVTLINAGWGGTGSDIGAHRVFDDLLKKQPDFIVIEFAVNDTEGELSVKMMEGLIQQILTAENTPGVMILMLKQDNGTTAQASHKQVGEHYAIPMVSFADLIDAQVATDGIALNTIFVDGLHPNDKGMAYIADFIKASLDSIYQTLPTSENLPTISTDLPTPIITDTYSQTYQFFPKTIVPL